MSPNPAVSIADTSISFLSLMKRAVIDMNDRPFGRVEDAVLFLREDDYPLVVAILVNVGGRTVRVRLNDLTGIGGSRITLTGPPVDTHENKPRGAEVRVRDDVLRCRLLDINRHALVKAYDVRFTTTPDGWAATGLDVHKNGWFTFGSHEKHSVRDWKNFVLLTTAHDVSKSRSVFNRIHRLKPAQLADLIEDASPQEQHLLLAQVHSDPDLEAHVFEEIGDDGQTRLFRSLSDQDVADILSRMRADDAADAVMDLAQARRTAVLQLLPEPQGRKVLALLGYNDATAGGLMGTDFIALPGSQTVEDALTQIRLATTQQPEALTTIYSLSPDGTLGGTLGIVRALQLDPATLLREAADPDVVFALPGDDIIAVTTRMADFNLLNLPVLDQNGRLLGIVTVDDALEMAIPRDWLQRRPPDPIRRHNNLS